MQLTVKNITHNFPDKHQIKAIIKAVFPSHERIPYWFLCWRTKVKGINFLAFYKDDKMVGFTYTIKYKDITNIFFLGVAPSFQSQGYGARILEEVKLMNPDQRIVLNIEVPDISSENNEQRLRRKCFYLRNGFIETNLFIYECTEKFESLITKGDIKQDEYKNLYLYFMGKLAYPWLKPLFVYKTSETV